MAKLEPAIEIRNLQKSYSNKEVLRGIDLLVEKGSIFALLGQNGAGKTTMVRILATLLGFFQYGCKNKGRRAAGRV